MAVYLVAESIRSTPDDRALAGTFQAFGGEVLAVDDEPRGFEFGWDERRTALLRFSAAADAERWIREAHDGAWAPSFYMLLLEDPDGIRIEISRVASPQLAPE